jgi:hypothetical protein
MLGLSHALAVAILVPTPDVCVRIWPSCGSWGANKRPSFDLPDKRMRSGILGAPQLACSCLSCTIALSIRNGSCRANLAPRSGGTAGRAQSVPWNNRATRAWMRALGPAANLLKWPSTKRFNRVPHIRALDVSLSPCICRHQYLMRLT